MGWRRIPGGLVEEAPGAPADGCVAALRPGCGLYLSGAQAAARAPSPGTVRQERATGAASAGSRVERRGKIEPQERRLRAQEWNGEARVSRRSGVCGLKSGTARQDRAAGAASAGSRVERRGKIEPPERRLRAQEWNGEARSSRRSGVCGLKSGTARQEQVSALASLSSGAEQREALGRRGKIEPPERRLRAQEWNGEARSSRRSGVCGLKSGTARQDRAAGAASAGSRVERRGKIEPPERRLRAQEWNGEARASFSIGFFELRSGTARSRGTTRQERQCLRAQVWNGAARASLELKRSTKGPLGGRLKKRCAAGHGPAFAIAMGWRRIPGGLVEEAPGAPADGCVAALRPGCGLYLSGAQAAARAP
ncbi:uncharacterized protein LOC135301470 [Passer domesticus]|uniref:uncharacterized protein LOC135301470 n=1 Tax=Passer domesticus TaxID=48849 RepID=UPI0030FE0AD3